MDITNKIDVLLQDEITTNNVSVNKTKRNIDVIGGQCKNGYVYDKDKKICVKK